MTRAVVVGSGPNGLAAAVTLAAEGIEVSVLETAATIGGGTRSGEYTGVGVLHDECSGFHPLGVDSAFSRHIDLSRHGLHWLWPDVQFAHPLESDGAGGGRGGAVRRSVTETAASLGPDGARWRQVFGSLAERFDDIAVDFTRPLLHVPEHPLKLARFGAFAALPAAVLARRFTTDEGRALFGGIAAHAFRPFGSPMSSAIGIALGTAAHTYGWPVAAGGSAAITTAMARLLTDLGGAIETGVHVRSLDELGQPDIVMLDTAPGAAAKIIGPRLPARVARAYEKFEHGPGAFQVSFAVDGAIPWTHTDSRRAGTVHVVGSYDEAARAERDVHEGRMPERPFVLLGQQYLADPSRSAGSIHPIDAYAHVPAGWSGDATAAIEAQIERFAPGFRDRVVARHVRSVADFEALNPNYVGGDIVSGVNGPLGLVFRPRISVDPYTTGVPGVYLCSAATPPGAGAHGMCGFNAANSALRHLR